MQSTARPAETEEGPRKCADIVREHGGQEPPVAAMKGCAFGSDGGTYIFGGDGDDTVHVGRGAGKAFVSGGKGNDSVHVAGDTGIGVAARVVTSPVGAIAVGALVVAAILVWVITRFGAQNGSGGGR